MPWSDLSNVTFTLSGLLRERISQMQPVTVLATPPDRVGDSATSTLSLYLYHVREAAASQNLPPPGNDMPSIATTPLCMDLFYVLTAHQHTAADFDAFGEQRLMGLALKTLHDFPVVTDRTVVAGTQIIPASERGRNNRLNIELRKIDSENAFAIWTTGERHFTRLAAYFQIGMVMLEPEPPRSMPGVVLNLGAFVTPIGSAVLTDSSSALSFTLPPPLGGATQTLEARPARPFLISVPGTLSQLSLLGENLTQGLSRRILLRNPRWLRLTPPADKVPLDPALNVFNGWNVAFQPGRIDVQVGSQITFAPEDGSPNRTIELFPGSYSAQLEVTVSQQMVGGQLRSMSSTSNEITFGVAPRIASHVITIATQTITLAIDPAFALNVTVPTPLDIQVVIDGIVYERMNAAPTVGRFQVTAGSIVIHASFDVALPGLHTVRLLVEGVDAQPYWIPT